MTALLLVALFYLAVLIIVALAATRPARSPIFLSPQALGAQAENVEFESEGSTLRGWWMCNERPRAVAVMLHGYVMNRSENAALAVGLQRAGLVCLLFDMRASGKSGGTHVGIGWLERRDALVACRLVAARFPGVPRFLIGTSMGAAAAAFALAEEPNVADALVIDSCYNGLPAASIGWWRFLGGWPAAVLLAPVVLVAWPLARVNPFRVNVGRALASVRKPTLIIHGRRDSLTPPFHASRNYDAAAGPKRLVWFDSAGHAEMRWTEPERYLRELLSFLEDQGVLAPLPSSPQGRVRPEGGAADNLV